MQIVGEHIGVLGKVDYKFAATLSESVIASYTRVEIDSVYVLFNEFKSVIAQRLIAERLLPIKQIGAIDVAMAEEASEEERKKRLEAAKSAGVGLRPIDTRAVDEAAATSGRPRSITSTSSRPSNCSRESCRSTSASRFFVRCSSP